MNQKGKKEFGVWMDKSQAVIVGREGIETGYFKVVGTVTNDGPDSNSSEKGFNNQEISLTQKFFKEIASHMQNVDELHVTGTGQIQEQFIKFLSETAQYKNTNATESTANKMSDEAVVSFITNYFE